MRSRSPWEGTIFGRKVRPIVKYRDFLRSSVQKAEPIEMVFGLWARMGRRDQALDGGPEMLRDIAMATNFGTQFAITGFVGCNFGCMIASDTLFNSRGGFSVSSYVVKT